MKPILSAWLLAISPLAAVPATTTLNLVSDPTYNRISVKIDPQVPVFNLADTKTTIMTGTVGARLDINPQAATTSELTFSNGRANGTNMTFSKSVFLVGGYNITVANVSAAFYTVTPPGLVTPANGQFAADQHAFVIDQGTITGSTNGAAGDNQINESFSPQNAATGTGSGTGTVTLVPAGDSGAYRSFTVTVIMPISVADSFVTGSTTVNVTATGTLKAVGTVQVPIGPQPLVWTGAGGNSWTASGLQNFSNDGTTPRWFFAGDNVTFNDSGADKNVVLGGSLQPGSITFQHNQNYTVTGAGPITGSTGLVKKGTGMLTIGSNGNTNSFTGPVSVEAGILRLQEGQRGALGNTSGVTVASGAQVNLNGQVLDAAGSPYHYFIAGAGSNGLGAITNSSGTNIDVNSGVKHLTLTGNASVGGSSGRFDVGSGGSITGNGFTLTKVGSNSMAFRGTANGSPINFVIASGRAWAENTSAAWGGAGGTLTIKGGARGGSYGDLSISTPVTIESSGILHNQGGGTGTWTGPISLAGSAAIDDNNFPIVITGPVTGTANLTKSGASITTIAQPGWTGNTTVNAGTLRLDQATLSTASTVSIGATAVLHLGFSGTQQVALIRVGGVDLPAGTYNSSHQVYGARFAGPGSLRIGPPASGYSLWAAQIGSEGLRPFDSDADKDGIPNGLEYVLNGNPGSASDQGILPVLDASGASTIKFSFFRKTESTAGTAQTVQYGSDLVGWTDIAVHPNPAANVLVEDQGGGISKVTVTINKSGTRMLVRLKVTQS